MNISKVHFGHMCGAGATMTGTATLASMLGHANPDVFLTVIITVLAVLVLTPLYANFK